MSALYATCPKGFDLYAFHNRSYYDMVTVRCIGAEEGNCDCGEKDFTTLVEAQKEYEKDGFALRLEE